MFPAHCGLFRMVCGKAWNFPYRDPLGAFLVFRSAGRNCAGANQMENPVRWT